MGAVTLPILPSPDFDATAAFYRQLGFREKGRWPHEYLIVERDDGIELHFWFDQGLDPAENDVACYVRFDTRAEAQALHDSWQAVVPGPGPFPRLHPPAPTDYGLLEFALIDPHGNLVRVGGALDR
jgi:catechol 2,3-dioxygenase-like lactoylglutathione lyase family enzyme